MTVATAVLDRVSAPTRRWKVDPAHSTVEFTVRSFWGLSTVAGRFSSFDGYYVDQPEGSAIELTIDARSLDTGNRTRDKHLRSKEFFDVEAYPEVRFTSTVIHDLGGTLAVIGTLDARGRSIALVLDAAVRADGEALEIEATTTVDHRQLGMTHSPLGMIRTPTTLHVKARLEADETHQEV